MSRLPRRTASLARPTTRRASPQLYILMAYDGRAQSLRLVWTGFRSRAPAAHEPAALTGLVQALLTESAELDQLANAVALPPRRDHPAGELTAREVEILGLISEGKTSTDIAKALAISRRTVARHLTNILRKLRARNRTEALLKAIQWGVLRLPATPSTVLPKTKSRRADKPKTRRH